MYHLYLFFLLLEIVIGIQIRKWGGWREEKERKATYSLKATLFWPSKRSGGIIILKQVSSVIWNWLDYSWVSSPERECQCTRIERFMLRTTNYYCRTKIDSGDDEMRAPFVSPFFAVETLSLLMRRGNYSASSSL